MILDTGEAWLPAEKKLFVRSVSFMPARKAAGAILPSLAGVVFFLIAVASVVGAIVGAK